MNVAICSLGLTFIPIEDMTKQFIDWIYYTTQLTPLVLVTENISLLHLNVFSAVLLMLYLKNKTEYFQKRLKCFCFSKNTYQLLDSSWTVTSP